MEQSPRVSAHPLVPPNCPLDLDMVAIMAAFQERYLDTRANADAAANDCIAAHHLRIAADALSRAVDGMSDNADSSNPVYVCDQLERVQESCGRAILALVNVQRAKIDPFEDPDDEDLIDTPLVPINGFDVERPKGGA